MIQGLEEAAKFDVKVFHAGTKLESGGMVDRWRRVLGVGRRRHARRRRPR
jgi:hypothetical protein